MFTEEHMTEEQLNERLCTPSEKLIADIAKITGDVIILGAGGKMGPSLAVLCQRAFERAGLARRVIAVSRFSDPQTLQYLKDNRVEAVAADLLEPGALDALPDADNVIYMAGRKFGTTGGEALTWAHNAWLSAKAAERYRGKKTLVFSSGNIYPVQPVRCGGATEETVPVPAGEYAMSVLARERIFEYAAMQYHTPVLMYRLNYAVDLRYGVLYDIAERVFRGEEISLEMPVFNCIWQGDANEAALRLLPYASEDVAIFNVSGPETASVRQTALEMGRLLGKEPKFSGAEGETAYFSNCGKYAALCGYPSVPLNRLIEWQTEWIQSGGRSLNKPTHFEEGKGKY
ncbi:MAG: NAD(P)-dependent oxidoreductase [Defluviitaleaceae bacterium]|nr:NAD(P)-dependent oxidoreductase [Defluviitaleaceae bacterium]